MEGVRGTGENGGGRGIEEGKGGEERDHIHISVLQYDEISQG